MEIEGIRLETEGQKERVRGEMTGIGGHLGGIWKPSAVIFSRIYEGNTSMD